MTKFLLGILSGVAEMAPLFRILLGAGVFGSLGALLLYFTPNLVTALSKVEGSTINVQQSGSGNVQHNYFGPVQQQPNLTNVPAPPKVSFQKYALFWVRLDATHYQLGIVAKLFNLDNQAHLIQGILYEKAQWKFVPRGSYVMQTYLQALDHAEIMEDNYIKPASEGYYRRLLPIEIQMIVNGGNAPDFQLGGEWSLVVDGGQQPIAPNFATTYDRFLSSDEWEGLLKPTSNIKFEDLRFSKAITAQTLAEDERRRRQDLLQELLNDYQRSHDNIPSELNALLVMAETYINKMLAERNEPFRFDAKTRTDVARPENTGGKGALQPGGGKGGDGGSGSYAGGGGAAGRVIHMPGGGTIFEGSAGGGGSGPLGGGDGGDAGPAKGGKGARP